MRFLPGSLESTTGLRVAIIGFGYVGSCLGVALAERGISVVAIDRDKATIEALRAGRCRIPEPGLADAVARLTGSPLLRATTSYRAVRDADVVIITVDTPVDEHGALQTSQLTDACQRLGGLLRAGQLVILKSTVPPGTTRTLVAPLLESGGLVHEVDFGLAFCPERLAEGGALAQVRQLPVVVGGCGPDSAAAAARFWTAALGVRAIPMPTPEAAEIVKLATNWWIDANVAIANELARYCSAFGVDVLDVIASANSLPKGDSRVNILLPSIGVGGPCLTKDPWIAWHDARDRGVELKTVATARRTNDDMPAYAAGVIYDELVKLGRDPASARVAVLGVAFKNDTGDLRRTPVRGVVDALRAYGMQVRLYDHLADPQQVRACFGEPPAGSLAEAVDGVDCVAVLAAHRRFRELDFAALRDAVAMPCLVFDGRAYYRPERIDQLRALGYSYRGIGR